MIIKASSTILVCDQACVFEVFIFYGIQLLNVHPDFVDVDIHFTSHE